MKKIRDLISLYSTKSLPRSVRIVEMGPRDGLQGEKPLVPSPTKIQFIDKLSNCGFQNIEVASFVYKRLVPQLADNSEVYKGIFKKPGITYSAFIPNYKGYTSARLAGVNEVAIFTSASEGFNFKNENCSISEGIHRFIPVMYEAFRDNVKVRGYVSCVMGCPYDGDISPLDVRDVALKLKEIGCYEISLEDTIGIGTPRKTREMIEAVLKDLEPSEVAVHFHNTYGRALENILVAMEMGVRVIDSSVASIGACPYAEGVTGNMSTEDLVVLMKGLGVETGIDISELCRTANWICGETGIPNRSVYQEHD